MLTPKTALQWLDVLQKEISSLSAMPNRYPLTEEQLWRKKGVRKSPVKGFIVYLVNEANKVVTVIAAIY